MRGLFQLARRVQPHVTQMLQSHLQAFLRAKNPGELNIDERLLPLPLYESIFIEHAPRWYADDGPQPTAAAPTDEQKREGTDSCDADASGALSSNNSKPWRSADKQLLTSSGAQLTAGPLKTWTRSWAKLREDADKYGDDPCMLCDLVRFTVCFNCPYLLAAYCLHMLQTFNIMRIKNRFATEGPGEYKDLLVNMEVPFGDTAHIVEVQLALNLMLQMKKSRHKLYKWLRLSGPEELSDTYVFSEPPPLRPEEIVRRRLKQRSGREPESIARQNVGSHGNDEPPQDPEEHTGLEQCLRDEQVHRLDADEGHASDRSDDVTGSQLRCVHGVMDKASERAIASCCGGASPIAALKPPVEASAPPAPRDAGGGDFWSGVLAARPDLTEAAIESRRAELQMQAETERLRLQAETERLRLQLRIATEVLDRGGALHDSSGFSVEAKAAPLHSYYEVVAV